MQNMPIRFNNLTDNSVVNQTLKTVAISSI